MSLDDLLPLLLVAFFVVNAFLRGGRSRRRRGGQQPGSGAPPSSPSSGTGSTGSAPSDSGDPSRPDDLASRLEEARRRVQQARGQGGQQASSTQPSATPQPATSSSTYAPGPASRGGAPASGTSGPATFLGREGATPVASGRGGPIQAGGFLGREGPPPRRTKRQDAAVVRKRAREERSARLPAAGIDLDPDDIVRGVVWREILGPPVAARRWRRPASRRPSR